MMWEAVATWSLVLLAVAGGWVLVTNLIRAITRFQDHHVTVYDHEVGVKVRAGRVIDELGPGRYATWPAAVEIERIDLRERSLSVPGQEMLTADKLPVRVSLVLGWRVKDAKAFRAAHENPYGRIYEVAQVVLRERIASTTLDEVAGDRGALQGGLAETIGLQLAPLAIEIMSVSAKDIVLVGASKQAYADLWRAQKESQAALERARGEQASLRALSNAARMLKGNPELMNLRILAALQARPGQAAASLVLGAPGLLPISAGPDQATPQDPAPQDPASEAQNQ